MSYRHGGYGGQGGYGYGHGGHGQHTGYQKPLVFNRIYVGYNSLGVTKEQWHEVFSNFGRITEIFVMKTKSGEDQGNIFISYEKTSEACLAVENMDGKTINQSPRVVKVQIAKPRDKRDVVEINYDHADDNNFLERIFFDCQKGVSNQDLKNYFSQFGTIMKVYTVRDKRTNEPKGMGWIRFSKQSEAAYAVEQADESYNVDWCDVRKQGGSGKQFMSANQTNWAPRGSGGNKIKYDEDGNLDYHSLTGLTEADLDFLPGFEQENPNQGPDCLEVLAPPIMGRDMAKGIFDMVPGMEECKLDTRTGICKVRYASPLCASYARDKLDGFSYGGMPLKVNFGKTEEVKALRETAAELKNTLDTMLQNGTSDTGTINTIMQSLQMVTNKLREKGMSVEEKPRAKEIPWCSAALPPRKPVLPQTTQVVGRLFFVATPEPFFDKILYNVFCRFGNLIRVGFEKDKRYGFAHYSTQEAADAARKAIHGHYIFSSKMKVEYASAPVFEEGNPSRAKRNKME